jgi:hypothetical protein
VQSTVLVEMVARGELECDAIFFADTMDEPSWVYETLGFYYMRPACPVYVVTKGKLSEHMRQAADEGRRWAAIPAFTKLKDGAAGPLRRQCTREYKIEVIQKAIRRLLGYEPGQHMKHRVICYQGISLDEAAMRANPSREPWCENRFPLIDLRMRREDCIRFFELNNLLVPKKSSCRYCPYHSNSYWRDLKQNYPAEFELACQTDENIRGLTKAGFTNPAFIHRSLVPLREAYFREDQRELFGEECSGHCGV